MAEPNKYQEKIYEFIKVQVEEMKKGRVPRNLVCEAGAGCGKSTTLVNSLILIPDVFDVIFLAFNKDIVTALKDKVPPNTWVQTFHSAGFSVLRTNFKCYIKLDDKKMIWIFQDLIYKNYKSLSDEEVNELQTPFLKTVGFIKNTCIEPDNENLRILIEKYSIDTGECDENILFDLVREGMHISNVSIKVIDYNDMIYLPVKLNLPFNKKDVVFVDETQDLNVAQLIMLRRMIKPNGFIVCVGDSKQGIYRFRGADTDAMQRMIKELNAKVLPLQMTYRCGQNIVKLANRLVPELEAYEKNPDGEIKNISYDEFYDLVSEEDMVLCRNTAPLIKPAFHLLASGRKAVIKGKDIGEGLLRLVKKFNVSSIEQFMKALDEWKLNEENKAKRKKSESIMQIAQDKYDCLMAISDDCRDANEIIVKINRIFADKTAGVTFSTIHRAKGLEAKKVHLLEPEIMPSKYAKKEDDIQQERNLMYVTITRAKTHLYSVAGSIDDAIDKLMVGYTGGENTKEFENVKCPKCGSGNMLLDENNKGWRRTIMSKWNCDCGAHGTINYIGSKIDLLQLDEDVVEPVSKPIFEPVVEVKKDIVEKQDTEVANNVFKKRVFKVRIRR